jgi:coatomer protein complex subunit gamma
MPFADGKAQSVQSVERFFKTALVDRSASVSSASLISSYHLYTLSPSIIKRWANEAQEAVNAKAVSSSTYGSSASTYLSAGGSGGYQAVASSSYIMQYHALGLLYLIREKDRMAITKLVQQFGPGASGKSTVVRNPMAICMLIRFARKVMDDDPK